MSTLIQPLLQGGAPTTLSRTQKAIWIALGGGATFGLLSLVARGLSTTSEDLAIYGERGYSNIERSRLSNVYGHVVGGLGCTALVAGGLFRTGVAYRVMNMNPWVALGGGLLLTIGSLFATQSINYEKNPALKHAVWTGFNSAVALTLCPLGAFGGQLLFRAAIATGAIVGSLSAVAASAPSDQFLQWGGSLSIGLGVLIAASFGQMFFPSSSLLYNFVLYGGLGLFSLLTLHDTQVILQRVRTSGPFDPINASLRVYLDTINIFTRMVMILSGQRRK